MLFEEELGHALDQLRRAPHLGIVYALCRRGEIAHHRVSNAIRVSEAAVADYLHAHSASVSGGNASS
jgi:hypothetical protein